MQNKSKSSTLKTTKPATVCLMQTNSVSVVFHGILPAAISTTISLGLLVLTFKIDDALLALNVKYAQELKLHDMG